MHFSLYMAQDESGEESVCSGAHGCGETAGEYCTGAAGSFTMPQTSRVYKLHAHTSDLQGAFCQIAAYCLDGKEGQ